jgi:subtilisin family serine protease
MVPDADEIPADPTAADDFPSAKHTSPLETDLSDKPLGTGARARKLSPKLRMISHSSRTVNQIRAERSAYVKVLSVDESVSVQRDPYAQSAPASVAESFVADPADEADSPTDVMVDVFLEFTRSEDELPAELLRSNENPSGIVVTGRRGNLATAEVPQAYLDELSASKNVNAVEIAEQISLMPPITLSVVNRGEVPVEQRLTGELEHDGGAGVLIGIVDVGGFDFAHPEFCVNGKTRFLEIWDQAGDSRPPPENYDYGSRITQEQMQRAIDAQHEFNLPATVLEAQALQIQSSHATHVASIAAGKHGVCPNADIIAVCLNLPLDDLDSRLSFYDSARLAHAVDYIFQWGVRVHSSGRIPAAGLRRNMEWIVVGNGNGDLSENELEVWYSTQDRFAVAVKPPDGPWIGPVEPGDFIKNSRLENGTTISIFNELYTPANGANHISCYLSPFFSDQGTVGVKPGTWIVRLIGRVIRDGSYHAWIERDDPRRISRMGVSKGWSFPSFFSRKTVVDDSTVNSFASGRLVITVGNLDEANEQVHRTSSQGPTRDGRLKPEIVAPGTDIIGANGFDLPHRPWVRMTGTSMASPFVTGVAGLMFSIDPHLTAAQINGILLRSARPLPDTDFQWHNDAGYGAIDPMLCLQEVRAINEKKDMLEGSDED